MNGYMLLNQNAHFARRYTIKVQGAEYKVWPYQGVYYNVHEEHKLQI